MKLSKVIQLLAVVTVLSLIYIHMQMQIIDLAYQGKKKEKQITDLKEDNGVMSYNISRLKSANHLGIRLLSQESDLMFRDNESIVQLVASEWEPEDERGETSEEAKEQTNPIINFIFSRSQAEARTTEKASLWKPWQHK